MYKELTDIFSPSGNETLMGEFIKSRLFGAFDEIKTDNIGNVICSSGIGGLCIECGMDSLGVMVTDIDGQRLRFSGVGGINASYLVDKKIIFKDQTFGIVRYDGKNKEDAKIQDLYLEGDFKTLKVGDFGVIDANFCENDTHIFGNGIGNRVGLWAVLKATESIKDFKNLTILFSAQKRIGAKGIQAFFAENKFDRVITVDGAEDSGTIKCGEGPSFVVADKNGVTREEMVKDIKKIAIGESQVKISVTENDMCMGRISALGKGPSCAVVAIPVACKDKSFEKVEKADLENAAKLLAIAMKEL